MDDEKLIEQIRQHEELYNMANKKYSDNNHKDVIWKKIGIQLKTTGPACKNRWISLRDQLRKALKKKVTKSGQAANIKTKWKYEDCMSFIIPFFKERGTHSNIAEPESSSEESIDESGDIIDQIIDNTQKEQQLKNVSKGVSEKTRRPKRLTTSPKKPESLYSKTRKIDKTETDEAVPMKYLVESDKSEIKVTRNDHPIDLFFNGLAATVKTFSPEYQHLAKSKLFSVVSELEWQQLQIKNSNLQVPVSSSTPQHRTNIPTIPILQTKATQPYVMPQKKGSQPLYTSHTSASSPDD